jgi:hypothetical protein
MYLEGDTDPPLFFGLLGVTPAVTGSIVHQHTLVKGLGGRSKVAKYVSLAIAHGYTGRVFGVVDGDGAELATLATQFDHPFSGPVFTWKAYRIESFFPQGSWSPAWGAAPNWQADLIPYAPYVALNRVHVLLKEAQAALRLDRRTNPISGQPLRAAADVQAALAEGKHRITAFDVESHFLAEMNRFLTALGNSLQGGLALLNGKWLFDHFLVQRLGRNRNYWVSQWTRHVTAAGGHADVRNLWQRITGAPP